MNKVYGTLKLALPLLLLLFFVLRLRTSHFSFFQVMYGILSDTLTSTSLSQVATASLIVIATSSNSRRLSFVSRSAYLVHCEELVVYSLSPSVAYIVARNIISH
jgi:hypothetical protein